MIPYGRHQIDQTDIDAVVDVLRSDWLTTGAKIAEFEKALADYTGTRHAVAVSNGTAALHCAAYAIGVGSGDEVIVPAVTFAATANCVVALGGRPVVVDVQPDTLLIDAGSVETHITSRTRAIIAVDYAGQPCDYAALRTLADRHRLFLISDSCHALGARYQEKPVGRVVDAAVFSFHPVKHITTGEGGAIVTDDPALAARMRRFRHHGIDGDLHCREASGSWHYDVADMGFNYRITDFQCALGICQLEKAERWLKRRTDIAARYDRAFQASAAIRPLAVNKNVSHAYHLYVVKVNGGGSFRSRAELFTLLRQHGIGVNVHYIPLNLHSFYQRRHHARKGQCPVAESAYEKILSLPIYPAMSDADVDYVVETVLALVNRA